MVTSVIPIYNNSCENKLLVKTLVVPIVDHTTRMEVQLKEGRMQQKYGTDSTYVLISKDSVMSKETRMFGSKIHIMGRTCTVHDSINATSTPSVDPLFETIILDFIGNITVNEKCPLNGSTYSSQ